MRIGQNPAKFVKKVAMPQRITVAVLNYIPFVSGYYADMLSVLNACLMSIVENTDLPYDLMVFDNGSCGEARQNLLDMYEKGLIQYLVLSDKNLGKGGAWNQIIGGAPGEIIAYSDNDCYFYPAWLSRSVKLLEHFPGVGMVTARPFRTNPGFYTSTLAWAEDQGDVIVQRGNLIPYETFREFDSSLGQTEEEIRCHYESSEDVMLSYKGEQAIAGSSHWQFVAYKKALVPYLPFQMDRPMGQVRQLDERINQDGYLRLMPTEPYVMNLSNTMREVPKPGRAGLNPDTASVRNRLLDLPPVRMVLLKLYHIIFRWYYDRG